MESEESDPKKWILSGVCLLMTDDWLKNYYKNRFKIFKILFNFIKIIFIINYFYNKLY